MLELQKKLVVSILIIGTCMSVFIRFECIQQHHKVMDIRQYIEVVWRERRMLIAQFLGVPAAGAQIFVVEFS